MNASPQVIANAITSQAEDTTPPPTTEECTANINVQKEITKRAKAKEGTRRLAIWSTMLASMWNAHIVTMGEDGIINAIRSQMEMNDDSEEDEDD